MKKILAMALILTVLCLATAALADNARLLDEGGDGYRSVESVCAVGDTVWILTQEDEGMALYSWREGMAQAAPEAEGLVNIGLIVTGGMRTAPEQMRALEEQGVDAAHAVTCLFSDGERLMSVNPVNGRVFAIRTENGRALYEDVVTLEDASFLLHMTPEDDWAYLIQDVSAACEGGYLLIRTAEWDVETGSRLCRLTRADMATGRVTAASVPFVQVLGGNGEGEAVLVSRDDDNAWGADGTASPLRVVLYDPKTDAARDAGSLAPVYLTGCAGYCPSLGALMYIENGRIMGYRPDSGETKQYGFVTAAEDALKTPVFVGNTMVIPSFAGVSARTVCEDFSAERSVTVFGGWQNSARTLFAARRPDVPIYDSGAFETDLDAVLGLLRGEDAPDVLVLNVNYSAYTALRDRGALMELSAWPALSAAAERMYPCFREVIAGQDDALWALPVQASSWGWYADMDVAEALGVDPANLPKNLVDLCAFITWFNDEKAESARGYALFSGITDVKAWLRQEAVSLYATWRRAEGQPMTFDTPEFRTVMRAIEAVRTDRLTMTADESEEYIPALFESAGLVVGSFELASTRHIPLPMTLCADTAYYAGVEVTVMAINARSENAELAAELLLCELECMSPELTHVLFTDETEPVENPDYETQLAGEQAYIEMLRGLLPDADAQTRAELLESLEEAERALEEYGDAWRYRISAEGIAFFREQIAPHMTVSVSDAQGGTTGMYETIGELLERLTEGQIGLEQFIREADNQLTMGR